MFLQGPAQSHMESQLRDIARRFGTRPRAVHCEEDPKLVKGEQFRCFAELEDGDAHPIDVVVESDEGDINAQLRGVTKRAAIESSLVRILERRQIRATASCGNDEVILLSPDREHRCTATTNDGQTIAADLYLPEWTAKPRFRFPEK